MAPQPEHASSGSLVVMDELQQTSERVVEGPGNQLVWQQHLATYRWAAAQTARLEVLDYGCGTGYGAALVAETARTVTGVDVGPEAIRYASERYQLENLRFLHVGHALPFDDETFDAVLSFQVIEHVDPDAYLREAHRVLRPGGRLFVATPNRRVRLFGFQKPWNPWHMTEYSAAQLGDLLDERFRDVTLFEIIGDIGADLARFRLNRVLTLPFTLPFVPDAFRTSVLRWASRSQKNKKSDDSGPTPEVDVVPLVDERGVILLAVATRR